MQLDYFHDSSPSRGYLETTPIPGTSYFLPPIPGTSYFLRPRIGYGLPRYPCVPLPATTPIHTRRGTLFSRLGNVPVGLNRVCRQISPAIPFDEVSTIWDSHKLTGIAKVLKCLILQIRTNIKIAGTTVIGNHG